MCLEGSGRCDFGRYIWFLAPSEQALVPCSASWRTWGEQLCSTTLHQNILPQGQLAMDWYMKPWAKCVSTPLWVLSISYLPQESRFIQWTKSKYSEAREPVRLCRHSSGTSRNFRAILSVLWCGDRLRVSAELPQARPETSKDACSSVNAPSLTSAALNPGQT